MDLNLQLVEGPHLLALPRHLGSGTFFVYLFSSPEAGESGELQVWFSMYLVLGSLQPYFGPRWNLWPSSW